MNTNMLLILLTFSGSIIPSELVPIPDFIRTLPGRNSSATHELVFLASQLPPLGSKSYYIQLSEITNNRNSTRRKRAIISKRSLGASISNEVSYKLSRTNFICDPSTFYLTCG